MLVIFSRSLAKLNGFGAPAFLLFDSFEENGEDDVDVRLIGVWVPDWLALDVARERLGGDVSPTGSPSESKRSVS